MVLEAFYETTGNLEYSMKATAGTTLFNKFCKDLINKRSFVGKNLTLGRWAFAAQLTINQAFNAQLYLTHTGAFLMKTYGLNKNMRADLCCLKFGNTIYVPGKHVGTGCATNLI